MMERERALNRHRNKIKKAFELLSKEEQEEQRKRANSMALEGLKQ